MSYQLNLDPSSRLLFNKINALTEHLVCLFTLFSLQFFQDPFDNNVKYIDGSSCYNQLEQNRASNSTCIVTYDSKQRGEHITEQYKPNKQACTNYQATQSIVLYKPDDVRQSSHNKKVLEMTNQDQLCKLCQTGGKLEHCKNPAFVSQSTHISYIVS